MMRRGESQCYKQHELKKKTAAKPRLVFLRETTTNSSPKVGVVHVKRKRGRWIQWTEESGFRKVQGRASGGRGASAHVRHGCCDQVPARLRPVRLRNWRRVPRNRADNAALRRAQESRREPGLAELDASERTDRMGRKSRTARTARARQPAPVFLKRTERTRRTVRDGTIGASH